MTEIVRIPRALVALALALAALALPAGSALADSTPVGPLPVGPTTMIHTQPGQLVAVALPHRAGGKVWRVATGYDGKRLRQVSEADVGPTVVLVFKALRVGNAKIEFGLTKGETAKAYESRQFVVMIMPS
jgi:hypothetical protein